MDLNTYKQKIYELGIESPKKAEGSKYIRNFDRYYAEKILLVNKIDLTGIKTVLDIGTGVGMLPYILQSKGISVEGTDVPDNVCGLVYGRACSLINLKRYELTITPKKSINLSKKYDLIIATRTVFDRQEGWDWNYFVDDCFNYCNRLFVHTNWGGSGNPFNNKIKPFSFRIDKWSFMIDINNWKNNPD